MKQPCLNLPGTAAVDKMRYLYRRLGVAMLDKRRGEKTWLRLSAVSSGRWIWWDLHCELYGQPASQLQFMRSHLLLSQADISLRQARGL